MTLVLTANAILLISNANPAMKQGSWMVFEFAALWLLFVWLSPRIQARLQFRRMPSAQGRMSLAASDSEMHVRSQHWNSELEWATYISWAEDESVFVLFPQPRLYVPIPKRAFTDEQLTEFREILQRKMVAK
jgi:hypothetical protein